MRVRDRGVFVRMVDIDFAQRSTRYEVLERYRLNDRWFCRRRPCAMQVEYN